MSKAKERLRRIEKKVQEIEETERKKHVISSLPHLFRAVFDQEYRKRENIDLDRVEIDPKLMECKLVRNILNPG